MSDAIVTARLVVVALDDASVARAGTLAAQLQAPLTRCDGEWSRLDAGELLLLVENERLALAVAALPSMQPAHVDFGDRALLRRIGERGARRQDLARALGLGDRPDIQVIDATAGWGRDSAVLAALGASVIMLERDPVVSALLADGLERARVHELAQVRELATRLQHRQTDATAFLAQVDMADPFVVLIDPMFPERSKSAAVRKEMQFFHLLVGPDTDSAQLLAAALNSGAARVVVKRPRKAPCLPGPKPSATIAGKTTRFDIYALRSLKVAR